MKRELPKYVYPKGKRGYLYFTRFHRTQRMHQEPFSDAWWAEYAALLKGKPVAAPGRSWKHLIASYKRTTRWSELAPRTRSDYDKVLTFLLDRIGPLDPRKMQRKDVIRIRDENAERKRFANYTVQIIRICMEHAIDLGWRPDNPAKGVRLLQGTKQRRKPWPPEAVAAFRVAAPPRPRLVLELCVGTGQRIGDVLKMRWDDIDGDGIKVTQGKTGAVLWLPFTSHLREALGATEKRGDTIVSRLDGGPASYRMIADEVWKVREAIGATEYDIHSLRYTAAAELGALGCSDELIQAVTGHTSKEMVALYAGESRQRARATEAQKRRER